MLNAILSTTVNISAGFRLYSEIIENFWKLENLYDNFVKSDAYRLIQGA